MRRARRSALLLGAAALLLALAGRCRAPCQAVVLAPTDLCLPEPASPDGFTLEAEREGLGCHEEVFFCAITAAGPGQLRVTLRTERCDVPEAAPCPPEGRLERFTCAAAGPLAPGSYLLLGHADEAPRILQVAPGGAQSCRLPPREGLPVPPS